MRKSKVFLLILALFSVLFEVQAPTDRQIQEASRALSGSSGRTAQNAASSYQDFLKHKTAASAQAVLGVLYDCKENAVPKHKSNIQVLIEAIQEELPRLAPASVRVPVVRAASSRGRSGYDEPSRSRGRSRSPVAAPLKPLPVGRAYPAPAVPVSVRAKTPSRAVVPVARRSPSPRFDAADVGGFESEDETLKAALALSAAGDAVVRRASPRGRPHASRRLSFPDVRAPVGARDTGPDGVPVQKAGEPDTDFSERLMSYFNWQERMGASLATTQVRSRSPRGRPSSPRGGEGESSARLASPRSVSPRRGRASAERVLPPPLAGQNLELASSEDVVIVHGKGHRFINLQWMRQDALKCGVFAACAAVAVAKHVHGRGDKKLMDLVSIQRALPSRDFVEGIRAVVNRSRPPEQHGQEFYDYQVDAAIDAACGSMRLNRSAENFYLGVFDLSFPMKEDSFDGDAVREFELNAIMATFRECINAPGCFERLQAGRLNRKEGEALKAFYDLYKSRRGNGLTYCEMLRAFEANKVLIIPWLEHTGLAGHWLCRCFAREADGSVTVVNIDSLSEGTALARGVDSRDIFFKPTQDFIRELLSIDELDSFFGRMRGK